MTEVTIYTEENLFQRLTKLLTDLEVIKNDIKQVKSDFTYDADLNSKGLSKDDIKLVDKASKLYVAAKFEEVEEDALAVFTKYKSLTGYDQ
jgi:hypothetical protein